MYSQKPYSEIISLLIMSIIDQLTNLHIPIDLVGLILNNQLLTYFVNSCLTTYSYLFFPFPKALMASRLTLSQFVHGLSYLKEP